MLEHLRTSPLKDEGESLFLGQVDHYDAPLLVPLSTARRHIWATGGTGSGKTSTMAALIDDRTKNGADLFPGEHIHFGTDTFPDWSAVLDYLRGKDA